MTLTPCRAPYIRGLATAFLAATLLMSPTRAGAQAAPSTTAPSERESPTSGFGGFLFGEGYPSTGKRVFGWSGLVVSSALLTSALVFHVSAAGKKGKLDDLKAENGGSVESLCARSAERCTDYAATKKDLTSMGTTYLTLYSASVMAFGASFLISNILWRNPSTPSAVSSPTIRPTVGLGSVGVGGTF